MADPTFETWLARCERLTERLAGVDLDALGDGPSWDAWNDGVTPLEYVHERLADAGFPMDLLD